MQTDSNDYSSQIPSHTSHRGSIFVFVFLMLCILTGISFWIANSPLMEQPSIAWSCMLAVSVSKAILVVLFFMHLWWERAWKYVLTIPALIMGFMLVLLLVPDIAMRTNSYSKQRHQAAPVVESPKPDVPVQAN